MPGIVDLSGATLPRKIVAPNVTIPNYITVEESHDDESTVTKHPVDKGAVMSDHIFFQPPTVKVRLGWSNSDQGSGGADYVLKTYAALLSLKTNRQLFIVYTGKRLYNNIFVSSLRVHTNAQLETAMIAEMDLIQLLLVNSATVSNASTPSTAAPASSPSNLADPSQNQPQTSPGTVQTSPQNYSASSAPEGIDVNAQSPSTGFNQGVTSGSGPTQIPIGVPNDDGGGAGPVVPFGM